jgi:AGCS family alanine or glycine:cation symporter
MYFRRRNKDTGEFSGGPAYYLAEGLAGNTQGKTRSFLKVLGAVLAVMATVFCGLAAIGMSGVQTNKISATLQNVIPANPKTIAIIVGVTVAILIGLIILGGIKSIGKVTSILVPFMSLIFIGMSLIIILSNISMLGTAFALIFKNIATLPAVAGGVGGFAIAQFGRVIQKGLARGVFSNEAGLGSSVMVHSNSNVKEPVKQGMWGIFEVFADTMIVCTLTALVVLTSGVYDLSTGLTVGGATDATLVAAAFNSVFGFAGIGGKFVAIAILLFAFTTVLGWNHYGTKAWEYLFGGKSTNVYKVIHLVMILFGALLTSSLAWDISDTFNGLMMIPNLIGVIVLSGQVQKITKNYIDRNLKHKDVAPMLSYDPRIEKMMADDLAADKVAAQTAAQD